MSMKEAYQEKMQAQLDERQAKIDQLKARADKAEAEQKIKDYEQIESLRTLKLDSESAWEELNTEVDLARYDLHGSFERASEKFK